MLSNNNLSFYNATKYSNEIIIIESSQEFSRDLEYTCYHQIYFDISQFIFFPTSWQMFFSSFFQINSREQMCSHSMTVINHDPCNVILSPTSYISLHLRANKFREVERACNLLQSLQSRRKLSGKVCIRPLIRYLRYLSIYPTTDSLISIRHATIRSLTTSNLPRCDVNYQWRKMESFAMRELFHSLFSVEVDWEAKVFDGEGREARGKMDKRKKRMKGKER